MNLAIDPKCHWAVNHMDEFRWSSDGNVRYSLELPGIGVKCTAYYRDAGAYEINFEVKEDWGCAKRAATSLLARQNR